MKHYKVEMKENNSISKLLKQVAPFSRVLEFGCANGYMTKYMSEELGCSVCIVEYDKESFDIAIKYAAEGICSDIMNFEWLTAFQEKFDYVVFADVLEHLSNPEKVIESCRNVLKDEGSLLVSVPNIGHNDIIIKLIHQKFEYTDIGLLDNTHIRFFAYDGINKFFEDSGFVIRQLDCTYIETGYTEQFDGGRLPVEISSPILNKLKERECGEIYQFIVCAQKKEIADRRIEFENRIHRAHSKGKIYFDRGKGYTEEDVQYVSAVIIGERYRCECTISSLENITALRYDPVEGQNCIITKCSIRQGGKELQVEYSSNLAGNTGVILLGPDPMIVVRTSDADNEITLYIEYIAESEAFIEEALCNFQDKQNAYLKSNYDAAVLKNQLDEANREIIECTTERNEIVSILKTSLDDCRKERDNTVLLLQGSLDKSGKERDKGLEKIKILERELEYVRKEKEREINNVKKDLEVLYSDFQSALDMKDRQIRMLDRELQKQKYNADEIARYKERGDFLEARLKKIEHTMSWRITKGLRVLGSKLQIK